MIRRRLLVDGIVQGVGFRPFVVNLARALGLVGFVGNSSDGVVIEIEGPEAALTAFLRRLRDDAPPLARIVSVRQEDADPCDASEFVIAVSEDTPGTRTLVPPDVATCGDCRREILDARDRRFGYPFTNCTNCGPRWTIIGRIPYDRPFTSMAAFAMCLDCRREYDDVGDRRFHAQPNACPVCGPRLWIEGPVGATDGGAGVIGRAAEALARHAVVAVKGLGGFQLAVRADAEAAVETLRRRKGRAAKPLAVMVRNLETAQMLARITPDEAAQLASAAAPIVLVERRPGAPLAAGVAPGHRRIGLMLPTTPLHHLLLDEARRLDIPALVMTSGNLSDEPICLSNEQARERLEKIADVFLLHDRDILRRADDSVLQVVAGRPLLLRRARGFAPVPVFVRGSEDAPPVLAVGPELKNTVCLLKDGRAFVSPHIGDLGTLEADNFFRETVATLQDLLECEPQVIAHDLHPGYAATRWAQENAGGRRLLGVQHHHAHLAAVLAEHGVDRPAVGLIMDGTGYGADGTIWGGEILVGDAGAYRRAGHFETVPLPGGDAAIRAPWRQAVSYLRYAYGDDFFAANPAEFPFQDDRPVGPVLEALARGVNAPLTSSCGRLFDALAAMVGPWAEAGYEAQAAIEFMALTDHDGVTRAQPFRSVLEALDRSRAAAGDDGALLLPVASMVRAVREARRAGLAPGAVSAMVHGTLVEMLARAAEWTAARFGVQDVALAGGVFQNELLLAALECRLAATSLRVWRPEQLPAGDGAVSVGQAAVAAAMLAG